MDKTYQATVVQFLSSRASAALPSTLSGGLDDETVMDDVRLSLRLSRDGLKRRPWFSMPWPLRPSLGAYEFVDPYGEIRWPTYLHGRATFSVQGYTPSPELFKDLAWVLRRVIFTSFRTMPSLNALPDETLTVPGYRFQYFNSMTDIDGNPRPSSLETYSLSELAEPVGPGYVVLSTGRFEWKGEACLGLNLVWSQAISLDPVTEKKRDMPRLRKRVENLRRHWNTHNELREARRHLEHKEVRAAVRAAAAGSEAAIRFYATEWGLSFGGTGRLNFIEKVDQVLHSAGRPDFSTTDPESARDLLHLYRARSSMHDGDCRYRCQTTGDEIVVRSNEARRLVEAGERFVAWLDVHA